MNEIKVLSENAIEEIENAFFDIPFENSDFQNANFVLAAQLTPARAYRALGLRMSAKLRAIDELKFARQLEEVDIEEKQAEIQSVDTTDFNKRRAQIGIDKILSTRNYTNKLLNDAVHDLNFMYAQFKRYPQYTREQFETEEELHFEQSLSLQIESQGNGAVQSLCNMHHGLTEFNTLISGTKNALLESNKQSGS
jgi:hypothetical protein